MRRAQKRSVIVLAVFLALLWAGAAAITQPFVSAAEGCAAPAVNPHRLEEHVRKLSTEFVPRSWEDHANLARTADHIIAELGHGGGDVSEQPYTTSHGATYRNVIARYGPDTEEVIVVGAHYDAHGKLPAADDNASGVAALLELGGMLAQRPPKTRVELVAYCTEEGPHFGSGDMGSAHHAAALKKQGKKVRAMFSLEMLGTFSDKGGSQKFPSPVLKLLYPDEGNYIVVVGEFGKGGLVRQVKSAMRGASDLPVESINAPRFVPGVDFSDHASYWDQGFPAVMVTDTAFYRNPRYHTAQDTWDTLDYARMAKVVQGVYCAVQSLASR